jgi:hypothetical protein
MKEDAVGGTCSMYGEEICIQSFGGKTRGTGTIYEIKA